MNLDIGKKIKNLRKQKGLSILQLSKLSEVSTGMISQMERDLVVPTVVSVWRIAQALDANIGYFFDDNKPDEQFIIRKGEHREVLMNKGKAIYRSLSPAHKERLLDFLMITLKSGQEYDQLSVTHEGEECGYVVSGVLTVELNGENWELHTGDSMYFKSTLPHKYMNLGEEECVSFWAMTPFFL